ncbi:craniofacial development protein 2 [Trichonephila clavipes]|nr:craniofacial development protein 2 [Trichonephila clavipes]
MTRTTLEMVLPSPNFHTSPTGARLNLDRFDAQRPPLHAGLLRHWARTHDTPEFMSLTTRRFGMKKDLSIGTWNIRTLYKGGALQNLINVFVDYHIDVLAIQEIRWLGTGILDKKDCTLYYSCQEKAHHFGVGFIVNKRLRNTVIDFQAISMRLCKIRLRGRHYNTTINCAHAPTDDKDETEKDHEKL